MDVYRLRAPIAAFVTIVLSLLTAPAAQADWDAKKLKLVRGASTTLRQATTAAERDLKGKAYAAQASVNSDVVVYTVKVLVGEKSMAASYDGKTGKLTGTTPVSGENVALLKDFAKIKGSLLAAMRAAETTAKGKTFAAAFRRTGNKLLFEVDAAGRDDIEKDVVIDALTGKIRKVTEKSADATTEATAQAPADQPAQ